MSSTTFHSSDVFSLLLTLTVIYGGIFAWQLAQSWARCIASSVKTSLEEKGVHVSSHGVMMEVPQYYDQEDYINWHRRLGFEFACKALAKYPNHRIPLPVSESSCSVQ